MAELSYSIAKEVEALTRSGASGIRAEKKEVPMGKFEQAMSFLESKLPDTEEAKNFLEEVYEQVRYGEELDACQIVLRLLDFGLDEHTVERFLKTILEGDPAADQLIAGTMECAKKRMWSSGEEEEE